MRNKNLLPRAIMLLGILLLGGVFLLPIWQIDLEAPQFPEGLELNIWVDRLTGSDGTGMVIQNINILNHYIGMQKLEPDSIAEFEYFPHVIMIMMGLGLLALILNKTWAYFSWTMIMLALGILGMYDFYLWLYDYGHNLDPGAPIKIPGQSFMPPVFGEKDLLNFYVRSYPYWGSLFFGLSIVFSFLAFRMRKKLGHA